MDSSRFNKLIDKSLNQNAGYVKLIASFPYVYTDKIDQEICIMPKGIKYRVATGMALFRKDVLISLLRPGESAWDIEYNAALRSDLLDEKFFCLNSNLKLNPPISYINAVGKGRWLRDTIPFLIKEGFKDSISNRKTQTWFNYIYYKLYIFRLEIFIFLKIYWYK